MACVICPWDISTHLHSVSILPVCHGAWIETDNISMSPGHELIPFHGMRDMFLGHIDKFTFFIEKPQCYGTWMETDNISLSLVHELVPVYGIRDMSLGHIDIFTLSIKTLVCYGAWKETDYISMSPEYELITVLGMSTHLHSVSKPPYVMEPGWRLIIFPCPRDMN